MSFIDRFRKRTDMRSRGRVVPFNVRAWNFRTFKKDLTEIDLFVACVDALARNIAKIDLRSVQKKKDDVSVVDRSSDLARVLKKPNEFMTEYDFLYKVAALYYTSNNVFIWPEYDEKGTLISLWPISYRNFSVVDVDGVLVAKFQLNYFNTYSVPYSQLIHLRNHYLNDDLFGESNDVILPAAELMDAQNQGIINGIRNSALIRGILKSMNVLKDSDIEKARDKFVSDNLRASNNGGVMVLDGKFDYQPLESRPYMVDADTMEQARKKIFDLLGVNEDFLQNKFDSNGYESVYEGRIEPFCVMLTQAMTAKLFTDRERGFGNEIEANMARVKYQPMTTVVQVINATQQLGLFMRDEYREMLGYAPLGAERGGDQIMIAVNNYQPIEGDNDDGTDD